MWVRFTESARKVVFYADEEAHKSGSGSVTTEHFLLGILRDPSCLAGQILERLGVNSDLFRNELELSVKNRRGAKPGDLTLSEAGKRVLDFSYEEAKELNDEHIGSEHLLLGIIRQPDSPAGKLFAKNGIKLEKVRSEITFLRPPPNPND